METTTHSITTKDGRTLTFNEAGQPDGVPILALHGTPGSRHLFPQLVEDAQLHGYHLLSYNRPGYGGSTPHPGRNVANAAEDIAEIAAQLNLDRLGIWGISGGGPHALAAAALLPELVPAAVSLASLAPYHAEELDWFSGMGQDNLDEFGAALESRGKLEEYIKAEVPAMLNADPKSLVNALISLLCPADVAVFTEDYAEFSLKRIREGIEKRIDGWVDDDLAFVKPWGFDLSQIHIPLLLMHGEQDQMVPVSHGKWLASKISTVEERILADDGHLTLTANRIPEVHRWLVSKL